MGKDFWKKLLYAIGWPDTAKKWKDECQPTKGKHEL